MGIKRCLKKILLLSGLALLIVYLTPCCLELCQVRKLKPCPEFLGPLTRNNILDSAQRLYDGKIGFGPESVAIQNGVLYTGVWDSRILRIKNDKVEEIATVGAKQCSSLPHPSYERFQNRKCGIPLGKRFDKSGALIVADLFKGVYKVNVNTGVITTLVPPKTMVDGKTFYSANDLDIAKDGDVYFTELSTKWQLDSPMWYKLLNIKPEGRILHYDAQTKKVRTIVDHLYFPNGIQLSPDEEFLIFSQSAVQNVMKYHLKGPKQGQLEVLLDNVPGLPDNIRPSGRGTYWLAIYAPRVPDEKSLWEKLDFCQITKFVVYAVLESTSQALRIAKTYIPYPMMATMHTTVEEFIANSIFQSNYGLVIEFTMQGEIIRSLHSPSGVLHRISQVTESDGFLYFSSPATSFIGKIKLP